jgi:hypothetical protein
MRCLRVSNKVLRWYTDCCRTPIANTAARPHFPVIGVVHSFMDHKADCRSRDEALRSLGALPVSRMLTRPRFLLGTGGLPMLCRRRRAARCRCTSPAPCVSFAKMCNRRL